MSENFIELETGKIVYYDTMKDQHELVTIIEKEVHVGNIGEIIAGEINSQEIEFEISRYYDDVDLLDKDFYILFNTKIGLFKVAAIDITYNAQKIRFNWLLDENATLYSGNLDCVVQIEGKDEKDKPYVIKTKNFTITVRPSLMEFGKEGIYRSWADEIEDALDKLEDIVSNSKATFIGTQAQFEEALKNGEIKPGMLITIR